MATKNECSSSGNDLSESKSVRILILGEIGIGKTTLIEKYISTVEADHEEFHAFKLYRVQMKSKEKVVNVEFIDLYPGFYGPKHRANYPKDVNAIILCFSIGHYETFRCIYNIWIYEARVHIGKNVPIFLVGLRSDVRLARTPPSGEDRLVTISEAVIIHQKHRFNGDYLECSMTDINSIVYVINKAFFATMEDQIWRRLHGMFAEGKEIS